MKKRIGKWSLELKVESSELQQRELVVFTSIYTRLGARNTSLNSGTSSGCSVFESVTLIFLC